MADASGSGRSGKSGRRKKHVKKEVKTVLRDGQAMSIIQKNPELLAQVTEQLKNLPPQQPGARRPTIVIYYNDVRLKKKKKHKKKRKVASCNSGKVERGKEKEKDKDKEKEPEAEKEADEEPPPPKFDAAAEGYQCVDAVCFWAFAGIPLVVPISNAEEAQLPKPKPPKAPVNGWLRKSPKGVPLFQEAKCGTRCPVNAQKGQLVKDGNGWAVFVVNGMEVDASGNPILPPVTNGQGKEMSEMHKVGYDIPMSGTVTLENDGTLTFMKRELKANEGVTVMSEIRSPESVSGVLVREKNTGNILFLSTEEYGVGGALAAEKANAEKDAEKRTVITQQPLGTVLKDVKWNTKLEAVDPDSAGAAEKMGVIVQTSTAPMYVPTEIWESEKKLTSKKPGNKNSDALSIQAEVVKELLGVSVNGRKMVEVADQIYRAKQEGKSLEEVQKLDEEEKVIREREMAEDRERLIAEHQKLFESRSQFFFEAGGPMYTPR
ncbi:unnamed protein product, partial [Mesorhabditis spiculigera]